MTKTPDHLLDVNVTRSFEHFSPLQIIEGYQVHYPDCYRFTLDYEGGYVNDPDDPGGCTNMGITIGTLQGWRNDNSVDCDDVKALTPEEAGMIYASNYWAPVWGNKLPIGINCQVWDFGVNAGPSRAIKYLQLCVGTTQDGIMGPATLAATEAADQESLLDLYSSHRQAYYESLSTFAKYGNGWTNRNEDCLALSIELLEAGPNPLPSYPPDNDDVEARLARLEAWAGSF